eukprot:NODE_213_length_1197_cov_293.869338_g160_i1.p1 GENE.NODE_213_length_1197_cov_293.869338_g160_i1~~NODE_213_length_1197_cov_293.869338_g160_i1.p1  ORF type:complete len:355 (-),score=102.67 NODE_213_length_1197_cov_293.869338_g160_i1:132-1166(-)
MGRPEVGGYQMTLSMQPILLAFLVALCGAYRSEYVQLPGNTVKNDYSLPLPHTYLPPTALPDSFNWGNVNGTDFLTKSLNQHLPQYCGSCWAHGALSALADRIKIARKAQGIDLNLAVQFILNCGGEVAGSCHGGSHSGTYQFIKQTGYVPYDTCLQYEACSSESSEGACKDSNFQCSPVNTCRTCSTFTSNGGKCVEVDRFPNASIAEFGQVSGADKMMAEIYARGPIACGVNAEPILKYPGGVFDDASAGKGINHIISVVGWGADKNTGKKFWVVRNSWGEYWGELGYFRIAMGGNQLGIEADCAWATPKDFTVHNFACWEDGSNCQKTAHYVDPAIRRGLA